MRPEHYRLAADAVLILHFSIVLFVVLGLPLILLGHARHWAWVRNFWFRSLHLAAIAYVVAEAWLGVACPLTALEVELRARAGETPYHGGFVEYWLGRVLYYQAPPWVFTLVYTVFGLAVAAAWWRIRPRPRA